MFLKIWYLEPDALPLESVFLNFTDEGVLSIVFTEMVFTVIWYLVVLILFCYWLMTEFSLAVQLLHPLKAMMDIIFPVDLFLDLDHNNFFFSPSYFIPSLLHANFCYLHLLRYRCHLH